MEQLSTEQAMETIRKDAKEVMSRYGLTCPPIDWSYRLIQTAGIWKRKRSTSETNIALSWQNYVKFGLKSAIYTCRHELAHELNFRINRNTGHDYNFKLLCRDVGGRMNSKLAGAEFANCASTDYIPRQRMSVNYVYTCDCGFTFNRKRAVQAGAVCSKCKTLRLKE